MFRIKAFANFGPSIFGRLCVIKKYNLIATMMRHKKLATMKMTRMALHILDVPS
jgi:hypothetical protein